MSEMKQKEEPSPLPLSPPQTDIDMDIDVDIDTDTDTDTSIVANSFSCCRRSGCTTFLDSETYRTTYRSWVLLSLALLIVSLSSGLIYGWPALRSRLVWEAANNYDSTSATATTPPTTMPLLFYTEERLGLMYTVGSWSTQGGRFFLGLARDRFGTRIVACLSLVALVVGLFGIGAAVASSSSLDEHRPTTTTTTTTTTTAAAAAAVSTSSTVFLSASLFAIGLGSGAQLCVQPVAGLFPNQTGIVLSSLSGAFQISGLVFFLLTARKEIDLRVSFWSFGICIVVLLVISAILLPAGNSFLLQEPSKEDEGNNTGSACLDENGQHQHQQKEDKGDSDFFVLEQKKQRSNTSRGDGDGVAENKQESFGSLSKNEPPFGRMAAGAAEEEETGNHFDNDSSPPQQQQQPSAWQQIKTPEYALLCTWFSIGIVPMQYYVGIIGYQLEELGDDETNGLYYTDLFSYCFAGAAITAPLAGYIADKHGLGVAQGLATGIVAIPFFLLAGKESFGLRIQALGLVAYGIGRMGMFGLYFTNCGRRFGYANYGTLAGLGLLVTALVSLLQYPLIAWTVRGHSTLINALLGISLVLQFPYFVWLYKRERRFSSAISSSVATTATTATTTMLVNDIPNE